MSQRRNGCRTSKLGGFPPNLEAPGGVENHPSKVTRSGSVAESQPSQQPGPAAGNAWRQLGAAAVVPALSAGVGAFASTFLRLYQIPDKLDELSGNVKENRNKTEEYKNRVSNLAGQVDMIRNPIRK